MAPRITTISLVVLIQVTTLGCVSVGERLRTCYEAVLIRVDTRDKLADIREETREQLADTRAETMQVEAERERQRLAMEMQQKQLEMEFCQANREELQDQVQRQIQENIRSKIAFNVTHGLDVGELEVDLPELEKLIEDRKKPPPPRQPFREDCGCEKQECGCEPGLQRRHCHRCRHRPCPCRKELDCGGPEAYRQALREPERQALRPAEIPMKLPVRLSFGMESPQVEETRIRRQPVLGPPREPYRDVPCDRPDCDKCKAGHCPIPSGEAIQPPTPIVDEARLWPQAEPPAQVASSTPAGFDHVKTTAAWSPAKPKSRY